MIEIDIAQESGAWPQGSSTLIHEAITVALQHLKAKGEVSIVLADNNFVQKLNHEYRNKDKPTNVLSFPQDPPLLGDIILAYETLHNEAATQGKSFEDHLKHLVVHGLLHLLGHDHEQDDEAQIMENLEIEILNILGIKNPYEVTDSVP